MVGLLYICGAGFILLMVAALMLGDQDWAIQCLQTALIFGVAAKVSDD